MSLSCVVCREAAGAENGVVGQRMETQGPEASGAYAHPRTNRTACAMRCCRIGVAVLLDPVRGLQFPVRIHGTGRVVGISGSHAIGGCGILLFIAPADRVCTMMIPGGVFRAISSPDRAG